MHNGVKSLKTLKIKKSQIKYFGLNARFHIVNPSVECIFTDLLQETVHACRLDGSTQCNSPNGCEPY